MFLFRSEEELYAVARNHCRSCRLGLADTLSRDDRDLGASHRHDLNGLWPPSGKSRVRRTRDHLSPGTRPPIERLGIRLMTRAHPAIAMDRATRDPHDRA